ncbi:MAG: hypothetical protein HC924_05845 [Synechococcaceae cyanobacterium SM2_3_2]|nr:hypothetical protein [Synechococcaceae cyanobacterium SM2_3_2]
MNTGIKSNLLLAASCISAIAAVGSAFELSSGQPDLGVGLTAGILVGAVPLTVWLFMSAVGAARAQQKK